MFDYQRVPACAWLSGWWTDYDPVVWANWIYPSNIWALWTTNSNIYSLSFSAWVPRELVSEAESTHQIKMVGACWCNACWSPMKSRLVFCSNFWVFFSDLGSHSGPPVRQSTGSRVENGIPKMAWIATHTHRITQIHIYNYIYMEIVYMKLYRTTKTKTCILGLSPLAEKPNYFL